jgi:predicted ATPase
VTSAPELPADAVTDGLANLVEKSLISIDSSKMASEYFLLETTRVYAREKLEAGDIAGEFLRRHAQYLVEVFLRAETDWETRPTDDWLAAHARHLDGLRAAVAWAFSPRGDASVGSALTIAALPLWLQLSLFEECLASVDAALDHLARGGVPDPIWPMKLHAARGACLLYQGTGARTTAAFERALELADQVGDSEYQLRAIWGLWGSTYLGGGYRAALALAERFSALAAERSNSPDTLVGERMLGMSRHCLGDLAAARMHLERMLERYQAPVHRSHLMRFLYDQEVVARCALAHVLWVQGLPDQAARAAQGAIERARTIDHPPSICYALTEGVCPMLLLTAGPAALEASASWAVEATRRHGVSTWKARGQLWHGLWRLDRGDASAYESAVAPALEKIGDARFVVHYTGYLSALCETLGRRGRPIDGLALVDGAIDRAERVGDGCSLVELLRVKAELSLLLDDPSGAEALFNRASNEAQHHDVLSWKLRSAMSLARWLHRRGKPARHVLAPVFARFGEGFATADLAAATALLDSLG